MIPIPRLLDYVVEILKFAPRPLVAREICFELRDKGVIIEKTDLNQILWKKNDRSDLVVDTKTFKWRYDPEAAKQAEEADKRKEETRKEVSKHTAFLEFWENIGFEFIGVRRDKTEKPLFFLREEGDKYVLVGPAGNLLREKSVLCSEPETFAPGEFTAEQVTKAANEIVAERHRQFLVDAHEIISLLRDTEVFADEVYLGPAMERVEDAIPVSGVIFLANVGVLLPDTIKIGWGTVLGPLYLIVDAFGFGIRSDSRYGVFKMCVYELLKRNLIVEREGGFDMTVTLENNCVYIGTGKDKLCLNQSGILN